MMAALMMLLISMAEMVGALDGFCEEALKGRNQKRADDCRKCCGEQQPAKVSLGMLKNSARDILLDVLGEQRPLKGVGRS